MISIKHAIISFLLLDFFFSGCDKSNYCAQLAADFKNTEEFHLKYISKIDVGRTIFLKGIDIKTGKIIEHRDGSGFTGQVSDRFQKGDTLIKDIGKYQIVVLRKGKKMIIPYPCDHPYQN